MYILHFEDLLYLIFDLICTGTFGRIYHATLLGEDQNDIEEETEVYVKTVTGW